MASGTTLEGSASSGVREIGFNPFDRRLRQDPYPTYRRVRERTPVLAMEGFIGTEWFLTRHADVRRTLGDARFRVDPLPSRIAAKRRAGEAAPALDPLLQCIGQWLFFLDPPEHPQLRRVASRAFSVGAVEALEGVVAGTVDELFATIEPGADADVMARLAHPLPASVTAHLLGVPAADRERLLRWSRELFAVFEQPMSMPGYARLDAVAAEFADYFGHRIRARRERPVDDLFGRLVAASGPGGALDERDVLAFCAMLFSVGQETTASAIGGAVHALATHPAEWAWLREHPERLGDAGEELLRFESPTQVIARVASEDVEIDGHRIAAGERVIGCLGAANRDPAVFRAPETLDLGRRDARHLAFGGGIHHCLGGALARLMCRCTLGTLLRRVSRIEPGAEAPRWRDSFIVRGPERLSVRFHP